MRIFVQELLEGIQVLLDGNEQVIIHVQLLKTESTVQRTRIGTSWRKESQYSPRLGYLVLPERSDKSCKVHGKPFPTTAEYGTSRGFAYKWELFIRLGGKARKEPYLCHMSPSPSRSDVHQNHRTPALQCLRHRGSLYTVCQASSDRQCP